MLTFEDTIKANNSLLSESFLANNSIMGNMPKEVNVEWEIDIKGLENVSLYHYKHNHRYVFSINYGEVYFETSVAKGKEIIRFLKLFK